MQQADLMLTTAQIGMALAGFAGLVTLLGRPAPRADAPVSSRRKKQQGRKPHQQKRQEDFMTKIIIGKTGELLQAKRTTSPPTLSRTLSHSYP